MENAKQFQSMEEKSCLQRVVTMLKHIRQQSNVLSFKTTASFKFYLTVMYDLSYTVEPGVKYVRAFNFDLLLYHLQFLAIGFFLFTLPHFIIERYHPPHSSVPALLCTKPDPLTTFSALLNTTQVSSDCDRGYIAEWYYLTIMLLGQFVAGTGSISLFAFAPACFQESVRDKNIPIFLGLWQAATFVGALVAFGASGQLLELYVDITQVMPFVTS